ncbi:MAG TPA: peptidylprolyl isomerase [Planctomycetota bacterium]
MRSILRSSLFAALFLVSAATISAQRPGRGEAPPVLIPKDQVVDEAPAPALPQQDPEAGARQPGIDLGAQGAAQAPDQRVPRPIAPQAPRPFADNRPLLEIDGVPVTGGELNELVAYFWTFRPGSPDLLLRDAVAAVAPRCAVQARFARELPALRARADAALAALRAGRTFAEVVAEYSDDDEAPTADGRYEFLREVAVQPFDLRAHTGNIGELKGPFLTQFGYHVLEVLAYQQDPDPKQDRTTVRHVLVMFPFSGDEPRAEIRAARDGCRIRLLEPGLRGMIPPELRGRIVE